jgi:hypothetical protein
MGGYRLELSPAAYRDLKVLPHEIQKSIAFVHFSPGNAFVNMKDLTPLTCEDLYDV